ncbi:MAG: hypothetical protein HC840_01270 [Leptolyngbyaceae cyanobacterium RM2_2_4]|nr:hypothetical protein [Leptolyngbyaceae cyanobacterium RM2_2_4]
MKVLDILNALNANYVKHSTQTVAKEDVIYTTAVYKIGDCFIEIMYVPDYSGIVNLKILAMGDCELNNFFNIIKSVVYPLLFSTVTLVNTIQDELPADTPRRIQELLSNISSQICTSPFYNNPSS